MRSWPLPLALISLWRCRLVESWGYCNDKDVSCAKWANNGECKGENAELVKKLCPLSCKTCSLLCRDEEEECEGWAKGGQCEINRDFMSKTCPTSCGTCKPVCYDKDEMCGQWARSGECKKNPSMILPTCPVSCGVCTSMCFDKIIGNPSTVMRLCPDLCGACGLCTLACEDRQKIRYSYLFAHLRDWRQNHTSIGPEGLPPAPACPDCTG